MKSGRRELLPLGGADGELTALVLCAVPIVRAGIMHLIRARFGGEVRVVGAEGWPARGAAPASADERFDISIFHLAGIPTPARLARIAAAAQHSAVIVVGRQAAPRLRALPAAVRWVALGAPIDEWCRVMRAAVGEARDRICAPGGALVAGSLLPQKSGAAALTPRQLDVFNMLCVGYSNRGIAEQLGLSIGTVKLHVAAILQALKAKRRVELVLRRAGVQQLPGARAAAANFPQRPALLTDAPADDRLE